MQIASQDPKKVLPYIKNMIGGEVGAAGQQVSAAMTPSDLYSKYASVVFGTPSSSYTPDFRGTQGTTQTSNQTGYNMGIKI